MIHEPALPDAGPPSRVLVALRLLFGLALCFLFVFILHNSVDLRTVWAAWLHADRLLLLLAVGLFLFGFMVRTVRYARIVEQMTGQHVPFRRSVPLFLASFGVSDLLPLRVGDVFRVLWYQRRFGLAPLSLISAMVVERILDFAAIVTIATAAFLMLGIPLSNGARLIALILAGGLVMSGLVLIAPALLHRLLLRFGTEMWLFRKIGEGLDVVASSLRQIGRPTHLLEYFGFSLAAWLIETGVMVLVWISLGAPVERAMEPVFAFALAMIGTLVPGLPGQFGSFELAGFYAFHLLQADRGLAVGTLVLTHLIVWAPTAIFAVGWLLFRRKGRIGIGPARKESGEPFEKRENAAL